ncbi:MAG: hypothetical protein RL318_2950 [Fibrobacterota bacterium]|jgi:hypothetical protein
MPSLGGGSQGRQWLWALVWTGRSRATVSRKGSLFAFWVVAAGFELDEQREVKHRLKEIATPARCLNGIAWRIVTDVTGVNPEDLDSKV